MADPAVTALARRLKNLEYNVRQTKQANLGFSTIDGGAIQATNGVDETLTMVMGEQHDGTNTAASVTGPVPPIPSVPGVFSSPGAIRVYWDGTFANALVAPMDFALVTVHVLPLADYDDATFNPLDQAHIYGSFTHASGGEISPVLEPGDYAVVLVSWTESGKFSEESQVGLGTSEEIVADTGPDGFAPATAPTVAWTGGIGSVFYRWNQVANVDPTEYALYVRAGEPPTTGDDTYLVASGNVTQAVVRQAMGPDPDDLGGPEILGDVTPGVDYFGVAVAYDADGQGPDSMPAIAQSVLITDPDIATDAITTRHLQAESVGADQIKAGSIQADRLAALLILTSQIAIGNQDFNGIDPSTMSPNLLPPMTTENVIDSGTAAVEGRWEVNNQANWIWGSEQFSPANDDDYWQRMAPGSLQALRVDYGIDIANTMRTVTMSTKVTVEPLTEYRFEFDSSMPGMDPGMPASGVSEAATNSVRWRVSSDDSFQDAETVAWKNFARQSTSRPDLTKFDRGIIRTGTGQTTLYLQVTFSAHYMLTGTGGFVQVFPELRKMVETTTVPAPVVNPSTVSASDVTPDPAGTTWKASAVWTGATSGITRTSAVVTTGASGGAFGPSIFSKPGRYATPGESHPFQQAKGIRITTASAGTSLGLRARIVSPAMAVPALAPMEEMTVGIGMGGVANGASGLDDYKFTASWYDGGDTLISDQSLLALDSAGLTGQGVTALTENYFHFTLTPPAGAETVVFWTEYSNGPAGNITASANLTPTMHGLRLYTLPGINYNYGNIARQHVEIDSAGVRLLNSQGQVQVNIPTDASETPFFRGGGEFTSLRVTGGASFEGQSEIAKDGSVAMSDGIKSPVGVPTIVQEYEQYAMGRQPDVWVTFTSRPTLNPSQITGMVARSGKIWVAENRGGGSAIWIFNTNGHAEWSALSQGWSWLVPLYDSRTSAVTNIFAGEYAGNHWAYVYNGSSVIINRIPAGVVPAGVHPQYTWNNDNNRLYVWYPHTSNDGRNVYKRLNIAADGGTMTLEDTVTAGSGTSRASSTAGLAGAVAIGSTLYTAARNWAGTDSYVFASGAGGALSPGARWAIPGSPVGFTHDGTNFWSVDTSGTMTRFSDWTWSETDHKIFAGITWFDSDAGGTGVHETDLKTLSSATLKKRISGIRITLPPTPDKGGADDPDRWRLYAYKGASLSLPGGRTSMFLQGQGGNASAQTTYIIPSNGLIISGTNPPSANNFPSAGPGKIFSSAVDGSSDPLIELDGSGKWRLGPLSVAGATPTILRGIDGAPLLLPYLAASTVATSVPTGGSAPFTKVGSWAGTGGPQPYTSYSSGDWTWLYSGSYLIDVALSFAGSGGGGGPRMGVLLFKNGTEWRRSMIPFVGSGTVSGTFVVSAVAGDTWQVSAYQNSGSAVPLSAIGHNITITRLAQAIN